MANNQRNKDWVNLPQLFKGDSYIFSINKSDILFQEKFFKYKNFITFQYDAVMSHKINIEHR